MPKLFDDGAPPLRLTPAEFAAIRVGRPIAMEDGLKGLRWIEIGKAGIRIRVFLGIGPDGWIIETYRPVIRVRAVSRMVPRQEVVS